MDGGRLTLDWPVLVALDPRFRFTRRLSWLMPGTPADLLGLGNSLRKLGFETFKRLFQIPN